jgi:hypothetical protein
LPPASVAPSRFRAAATAWAREWRWRNAAVPLTMNWHLIVPSTWRFDSAAAAPEIRPGWARQAELPVVARTRNRPGGQFALAPRGSVQPTAAAASWQRRLPRAGASGHSCSDHSPRCHSWTRDRRHRKALRREQWAAKLAPEHRAARSAAAGRAWGPPATQELPRLFRGLPRAWVRTEAQLLARVARRRRRRGAARHGVTCPLRVTRRPGLEKPLAVLEPRTRHRSY